MAYALSGERPRGAVRLYRSFTAIGRWIAEVQGASRRRKALSALFQMNDYQLWDIGITRADLQSAVRSDAFDIDLVRDCRRSLDVWPPR
jgi:uncharacterized protein YjiS (DUF1127 family)